MPTRLPERRGARAIRPDEVEAKQFKPAQIRKHDARDAHNVETVDWLALFVLSLRLSAMFIAALANFGERDAYGAAAVLVGTAIVTAGVLGVSKAPRSRGK